MTAEGLSMAAGAILSLAFSYGPGLNVKFAAIKTEYKQLIMLGLLVLVSAGAMGLACHGSGSFFGITVTCDEAGLYGLVRVLVAAIIANQGVFSITPKTNAVKAASA